MAETPRFEVRAVGAFEQQPGCPEYSVRALTPERLERPVPRRVLPPVATGASASRASRWCASGRRSPPARTWRPLIEDPWRVFACPASERAAWCSSRIRTSPAAARDAVYYVRAIEEASPIVNADPLRCTRDESGRCVEVDPCWGDYRTETGDDCSAPGEERAWSSPIYVDHAGAGAAVAAAD